MIRFVDFLLKLSTRKRNVLGKMRVKKRNVH